MIEAAIWGAVGASTLLIGAALAFTIDLPPRIRGLILAFGAGALFGAVAYELFEEAVRASMGGYDVLFGFAAGAIVFFLGSVAIDRLGSGRSDGAPSASGSQRLSSRRDPRTDGLSVLLGTVLDGIPESVVLGASLIGGAGVGIPVLVAIAISNVPEGLSATEDLTTAGGSMFKFIDAIRAAGGVVDHGMALFYYGIFREAEDRFANGKVQLHHIATWRQVLEVARAQALFDEAKLASVQSFLDDPLAWSAAHGGVAALPTS